MRASGFRSLSLRAPLERLRKMLAPHGYGELSWRSSAQCGIWWPTSSQCSGRSTLDTGPQGERCQPDEDWAENA
jgi:hypothetical protein